MLSLPHISWAFLIFASLAASPTFSSETTEQPSHYRKARALSKEIESLQNQITRSHQQALYQIFKIIS